MLSLISHIALRKGIYHIDKKWGDKLEKTFADIKKLLANKRRKRRIKDKFFVYNTENMFDNTHLY